MEKISHRFLSVVYQLHTVTDGEMTLQEQTASDRPFEFITGFGIALDAFEKQVEQVEKGSTFDFTLQPSEAFGDYDPEGVHKLDREVFTIDGQFDREHVYPGAVVTLTDQEDHQFMAKVKAIEIDGVVLDSNHPLAGQTLNFTGLVRENREATEQEINNTIKMLTGGCQCGDGCGSGGCGGGCGGGCCGK